MRLTRDKAATKAATKAGPRSPQEPTVAINAVGRRNFRRRRFRAGVRRWRAPILAVLVISLVAGAVWLLYFSDKLTTRDVSVQGNTNISAGRVKQVADVPLGGPMARLDVDAIRARVEGIAIIDSAEVSRSWPHTLSIEITERVPVAVVQRAGKSSNVDVDGVLFPGARGSLPVIRTSEEMSVEALSQGARVAAALPEALRGRLAFIQVDSIDRIQLHLRDGRLVVWGSAANSQEKAEVAQALLERKVRVVDVTVPGRPTTS